MKAKSWIIAATIVVLLGLAVWGFMAGRKELQEERERERPVKAPARVIAEQGEQVVVLDQTTRERAGIAVAVPAQALRRAQVQAFGTVLSVQELVDLRNNATAARAQLEKARAALEASHQDYRRLKILHAEDRAISDKALQAAEATRRSDEASLRAAEQAVNAIEQGARQQFGVILARAAIDGSLLFQRLAQQQVALLQVTLPAGTRLTDPPASAELELSDGATLSASLISAALRTDPRLQGQSFYYSAPGPGLLPGMSVSVRLPSGPQTEALKVPMDAVVWWQGKAWVYAQQTPDRFMRLELPTDNAAGDGWFVAPGFAARKPLVIRGAQLLLSEELRAQIQVGETGEKK